VAGRQETELCDLMLQCSKTIATCQVRDFGVASGITGENRLPVVFSGL
jgi:hypothetical protein